ncbi:MAG: nucleotide sugar dehydrogenase, partial [Candidatus Bathyarchaeia archaeon]
PEDVDTVEKRSRYTASIVGCGYVGVLHAYLFVDAGFKVVCADSDQRALNLLSKGKTPFLNDEIKSKLKKCLKSGVLEVTGNIKNAVSRSNIVVVTTPIEIDEKKRVDYSNLKNVCKQVGLGLRQGTLIVIASTVGVGFTESVIKEILENSSGLKVGADFGLVYSPVSSAVPSQLFINKRFVAGIEKNSLNSASIILGAVTKGGVKRAANVKILEFAKLSVAAQKMVNIALANELAIICENAGVDFLDVLKLLNDDACGMFLAPKIAERSILDEAKILLEDAENVNMKFRTLLVAEKVNDETLRHVLDLTRNALSEAGRTLKRARIAMLGIAEVPNMKSQPKAMAKMLAEMLEAKGARVNIYDPNFSEEELAEIAHSLKRNLSDAVEGADCILIVTGHDQFRHMDLKKLKVMMRMPAAIIDLEGVFEPNEIRKEGLIYRGLGRGAIPK